jgi:hypothetical protein
MYNAVSLRLLRILALNDGEAALAIMVHAPNQFLLLVMFLMVMLRAAGYFSGMDVRVELLDSPPG